MEQRIDRRSAPEEQASLRALQAGDLRAAAQILRGWTERDPADVGAWLRLAGVLRRAGDGDGTLRALTAALQLDPRCFPALLMLATLREAQGDTAGAARQYAIAAAQAPPDEQLDHGARAALDRGRKLIERHTRDLREFIHETSRETRLDCRPEERRRLDAFIDTTLMVRKRYVQQPMEFCYPGLPSIEFYDRHHFPWLDALEAVTPDIRRELSSILQEGGDEFSPYVDYDDHVPLDQWRELNRSPKWSAWHLFERGQPLEERYRRVPATVVAVSALPQPVVPLRSPSALFSALTPRTRIPPHTGVANFRLLVHLPLIVPPGCGFRVGGETRVWREGEAWVFDDTIEHEAWNDSDELRVILICDVWSPFLSPAERTAIAAVIAARDRFTGAQPRDST